MKSYYKEQNLIRTFSRPLLIAVLIGMVCTYLSCQDESGLICIGYLNTSSALEIQNSPWGIQIGSLDQNFIKKAAELGIKWTRLAASWPAIEKTKGEYDWEKTDKAFDSALENGITPFVTLGGANNLYTKSVGGKDQELLAIYGQNPAPPVSDQKALAAWLKFVELTVNRYKNKIKYWEVWNEPNHHHYWGDKPNGRDYGRLLKETAILIKQIDPESKVIGGSMAGLDPEFTADFLSTGTAALIDIITYHNYGAIPEERIYKALKVQEVIAEYNPDIELWQGECGYPSHSSTRDYRGISPWGLKIQAKWLLRQSFTDIYFCGATLSNYFKLVHIGGRGKMPDRQNLSAIDSVLGFPERSGSRVKSIGVNEKCVLSNPDFEPKPAYFAYQNLCAIMDSRYKISKNKTNIEIKNPGIFYGIGKEDDAFPSIPLRAVFSNQNHQLLVAYWLPWHPQEIVENALIDLYIEGSYRDPVLIDLLTGKVFSLTGDSLNDPWTVFRSIPMADYPLVVAERSAISVSAQGG